jgi:hypothetical protein
MDKLQQDRFNAIRFEDLEEETIEITPVVSLSDLSDTQDMPEIGASLSWNSCTIVAD